MTVTALVGDLYAYVKRSHAYCRQFMVGTHRIQAHSSPRIGPDRLQYRLLAYHLQAAVSHGCSDDHLPLPSPGAPCVTHITHACSNRAHASTGGWGVRLGATPGDLNARNVSFSSVCGACDLRWHKTTGESCCAARKRPYVHTTSCTKSRGVNLTHSERARPPIQSPVMACW